MAAAIPSLSQLPRFPGRDCCSRAKNQGWRLVMGFVPSEGGAA